MVYDRGPRGLMHKGALRFAHSLSTGISWSAAHGADNVPTATPPN
jgi:hypothetical protein